MEEINQYLTSQGTRPAQFYLAQMSKFNQEEKRWVNKGPVLLYIYAQADKPPQLVANYLYGTKSVVINMTLWEFWERYRFQSLL